MSTWVPNICLLVAVALAAVAAWTDFRTGKIPNWLTLPPLVLGFALNALLAPDGWRMGLVRSALGVVVCGLVPYVLFRKRLATREGEDERYAGGGGDVKLFAALGALLGYYHGIEAQFFSFCAAGLFGMARLAWHGRLLRVLTNTLYLAINPFLPRKWRRELTADLLTPMRIGGAILAGTSIAALTQLTLAL